MFNPLKKTDESRARLDKIHLGLRTYFSCLKNNCEGVYDLYREI